MNIKDSLYKRIVEVAGNANKVAFLGSKELSLLKIDFGKTAVQEVLFERELLEVKRFKSEAGLYIGLAMKKSDSEISMRDLTDIDYDNKRINIGDKSWDIVPIMFEEIVQISETAAANFEAASSEAAYHAEDYSSVGIKLQGLFKETSDSFLAQKKVDLSSRLGLYESFKGFNAKFEQETSSEEDTVLLETQNFFQREDSLSITDHSFALSPDFNFDIAIDFDRVIKPRDTSAFWFQIDLSHNKVKDFWSKLGHFYKTSPKDLEYKLREIYANKKLPVFSSLTHGDVPKRCFFTDKLAEKVKLLSEKNEYLLHNTAELEKSIVARGLNPDDSPTYINKVQQQLDLAKALLFARTNLENFQKKIEHFSSGANDFEIKFYVHVFGRQSLITKYDDLIGQKLLFLNAQINDIQISHEKLEKTLIEKLQSIHEAKKAHAKLQFLEEESEVSDYIARQQKAKHIVESEQRKKVLDEIGQLHENADFAQEAIDEEYRKINYFLDNLKTIENIDNYEQKLFDLKVRQQQLNLKKDKFKEYLHVLRLRVNQVEEGVFSFITSLTDTISIFQTEIAGIYLDNKNLLSYSTQKLWDDWSTKGVSLIQKIFDKKNTLIRDFASVMVLQINNVYKHQRQALMQAQNRQKEWENIYKEIQIEFKEIGYYLDPPKPSKINYNHIKEINIKNLKLSPDTKKVLNYQPNFNPSTRGNVLFGLDPKNTDDDNFVVMDQVWTSLTKDQEKKLKQKIFAENQQLERENLEKKLAHIKANLQESLEAQKYQFQKSNILDFFPEKTSGDKVKEKSELFEKYLLHSWKDKNFTASYAMGELKETLFNFAKSLFLLKSVNVVNSKIQFSDTGLIADDDNTEIFTDKDYFIKSKGLKDFSNSASDPDFFSDESDEFDIENENYLELVDSLDDLSEENAYERRKGPTPPTLEEWAQISIKKFREKKKIVELVTIQNKILLLEDEIDKVNKAQSENSSTFNVELRKRNYLHDEIKSNIDKMQKFLLSKENELNIIFSSAQKEVDDSALLEKSTNTTNHDNEGEEGGGEEGIGGSHNADISNLEESVPNIDEHAPWSDKKESAEVI